ncbi:VOC family protein (plasmid) [Coraliomargarita sp. W4R53]
MSHRSHLVLAPAESQRASRIPWVSERLTTLGATEVDWDRPDTADYIIMQDAEGNRFCVIEASEWSGWEARRTPFVPQKEYIQVRTRTVTLRALVAWSDPLDAH